MKKLHLKIGIIAVAISALGYWSCSKDSSTLQATTDELTTAQKGEIAPNSDEIKAKIDAFDKTLNELQQGENTDFTLTTDDAVWNIEALLNVKYGLGNFQFTQSDETTLKFPIDNKEKFSAVEIVELYEQAFTHLRKHYISLENQQCRQLILADVDIVTEKGKKFFTVMSAFGISSEEEDRAGDRSLIDYKAYTGAPCGTTLSPPLIRAAINASRPTLPFCYAYTSITTSPVNASDYLNPAGPIAGTQRREYLLYATTTHDGSNSNTPKPGFFSCYSEDDHDWYISNLLTISNQLKPSGKVLSFCEQITTPSLGYFLSTGQKKTSIWHETVLRYGVITQNQGCNPLPF